jgi:hypothetical protein
MSGIKVSVLYQILAIIERNNCNRVVKKYQSAKYSKGINNEHMVSMIFILLSSTNSNRGITNGLMSLPETQVASG